MREIILVGLLIAGAVVWGLYALISHFMTEEQRWREWAVAHECKVVGKTRDRMMPGFGFVNGKYQQTFYYVPGTTKYACNDGVTYER